MGWPGCGTWAQTASLFFVPWPPSFKPPCSRRAVSLDALVPLETLAALETLAVLNTLAAVCRY